MKKKIALNGQWSVQKNGRGKKIKANVPGDIYKDLLDAKKIPDPYYRDNENELQWIGESDWQYSRSFKVDAELLQNKKVLLKCDGLDTLATVSLNGAKVAETDNMFREYEWDVKKLLKPGNNIIRVNFSSTISYIEKREGKFRLPWWGMGRSKIKAANHGWVRKEQCNYGWDWGIKAVTCGIWRNIALVAYDVAEIESVYITQDHSKKNKVDLAVAVATEKTDKSKLTAAVKVLKDGKTVSETDVSFSSKTGTAKLSLTKPELWWPNNMGNQPLYDVEVTLKDAVGNQLDALSKRIGLRTLRLDTHKDKWGESFQFVVNGVPFFAKGANWIPADGIQARMTPAWYYQLVKDAAEVNMNMLRVWGGGIYEDESFYNACDELGICIWQDFMFACSTYPTFEKSFMATVKQEAIDNVKRLRHHPSIALWCGNNELEMGLVGDQWQNNKMPWDEYKKLFDKLLPSIVSKLSPGCDYWPGSPHTPGKERNEHNNPNSGDAHLWSVWHGKQPFEWYRTCEHRFNSEFGFQSFPDPKTVYGYTQPEDRNITSWIMEHHQRSGIGNTTIMQYMLDWFRLPEGFENTLWASQILQGMAIKYACEHWRRSMPRGMGTLYWQLNDTWPVASWSSIDYHGRWKALQYMAKDFFFPLLISGLEDLNKRTIDIHVTSDLLKATAGEIRYYVTDLDGKVLQAENKSIKIPANANKKVATVKMGKLVEEYTERNLLTWIELIQEGKVVSSNMVLFSRPKHLELSRKPQLSTKIKKNSNGFEIEIKTKKPVLWCWLEVDGKDVKLSDNFFNLRPNDTKKVSISGSGELTVKELKDRLMVKSLVDTY